MSDKYQYLLLSKIGFLFHNPITQIVIRASKEYLNRFKKKKIKFY